MGAPLNISTTTLKVEMGASLNTTTTTISRREKAQAQAQALINKTNFKPSLLSH